MLDRIVAALADMPIIIDTPKTHARQAAVLVALRNRVEPEVVLTLRSTKMNSHSGEVAFPGGWWEPDDADLIHTALRETHEEIGVAAEQVDVVGLCKSRYTRGNVRVQPIVGVIPDDLPFTLNPHEIETVFTVPLAFFAADKRLRTDVFSYQGRQYWSPAYQYQGYEIWGFTAGVLLSLLNKTLDLGIEQANSAPVRHYP